MREKETEIDAALQSLGVVTYKSAKEAETAFKKVLPGYTAKQLKEIVAVMCVSDEHSPIVNDVNGHPEANSNLRDNENVPLPAGATKWEHDVTKRLETKPYRDSIDKFVKTEVLPHVPDVWIDYDKTKIGYEIPLTRYFYKYTPPRPLVEIDAEVKQLEVEIQALLNEVIE